MTLADFRARVSGAIGLSNTNGSSEQGFIDDWVNEGIVDFLRRTKMHVKLAALALTADQYSYELDTDILAMKDAWVEPSSGTSMLLEPRDASDILYMRTLVTPSVAPVMYYALEGSNLLLLHPAPASNSDQLHILYVPRPTALAATGDDPSASANGGIPTEFHPVIEQYVLWKAADFADDASSKQGQQYFETYMSLVSEAKLATVKKAGVRLAGVRWGKKNRFGIPSTPGTDIKYP